MDEKVQAHAQLALIPDIWPLSLLSARTEKKSFCWWAGPRVGGHEMRVMEEQRTRATGNGMGLVSLEGPRLAISSNGSLCMNWKLLPSHERSMEVTRQIRIHKAD